MSIALDPLIGARLQRFARRQRRLVLVRAALAALVLWILGILALVLIDAIWVIERPTRMTLSLLVHGMALTLFAYLGFSRSRREPPLRRAAIALESARPEMRDRLLSAFELASESARGSLSGSRAFIEAAQRDVAARLARLEIPDILPLALIRKPLLIAGALAAAAGSMLLIPDLRYGTRLARAIIPGIDLDRVSRTKIEILAPSPASADVPANEWTAVRVATSGQVANSGSLEWQTPDGASGAVELRALEERPTSDGVEAVTELAGNLPVGDAPIRYRVLAGDGVTAWHRLEPKPRPKVVGFEFRVTPPSYSRLPEETAASEEGNIQVLRDSTLTVTASFAAPVVRAELRLIDADVRIPMKGLTAAGGNRWEASFQVTRDDRYQVVASDAITGFDNSLSPQYAVVGIPDAPPQVIWTDAHAASHETSANHPEGDLPEHPLDEPRRPDHRRLIPSRASIELAASTEDEMPIEELFQETAINQAAWQRDPSPIEPTGLAEATRSRQSWVWDLDRFSSGEEPLRPGDLVRTRMVAVDRKGQRGESEVREYLISDQAFSVKRRDNLLGWGGLIDDLKPWADAVTRDLERLGMQVPAAKGGAAAAATPPAAAPPLAEQTQKLLARINKMNAAALHDSEAGELEPIGRGIARIDAELSKAAADARPTGDWMGQLLKSVTAIDSAARLGAAHRLSVTLADDLDRMDRSIAPLTDPGSGVRWESFAAYHRVTTQQFLDIRALIDSLREAIPESTRNHNEQLQRWIDDWLQRIEDHAKPEIGEQRTRAMAKDLLADISTRKRYGMLDGRLPSMMVESQNRLHELFGDSFPAIQAARQTAATKPAATADQTPRWQVPPETAETLSYASEQLDRDSEFNLRRPEADRRYVTDVRLMRRVLDTILAEGFSPPEGKDLSKVLDDIAAAFRQLEAIHLWNQWLMELRTLADTERWDIDTAGAWLDAPRRWERVQRGLDHSLGALERSGIPWEVRQPLHDAVHHSETSRIAGAITTRRYQRSPAISLADDLDKKAEALVAAGEGLAPVAAEARRRLQAYLPDLGEMAGETAESLRKAEQAARQPEPEKPRESSQQLAELQRQIAAQAESLKEALIDEANTQDLTTREGMERAREADIASRALEMRMDEAAEATNRAISQAEQATEPQAAAEALQAAADPLAQAAQTLERIANHYQQQRSPDTPDAQANEGADLAALEEELDLKQKLDEEFARSKMLAEALRSDPREMLDQLAQELKRNEAMRKELQRIARQSIRDAQQTLDQQAQRERELRLELERQDPRLLDEKRRLEDAIRTALDQTAAVQRSRLHTARQTAARLLSPGLPEPLAKAATENRQRLDAAVDQLQQATQAASGIRAAEQELMEELKRTAEALRESLGKASEAFDQAAGTTDQIRQDPKAEIPGDPRKAEQRDMQNLQRQARDTLAGAIRGAVNRTNQAASQSEQSARNANGQTRQAERALSDAQKRLDQKPDDPELKRLRDAAARKVEGEKTKEGIAQEESNRRREEANRTREQLAEIGRTPLPALDTPRPAGELTEAMLDRAAEEIAAQRDSLAAAAQRAAEAAPVLGEAAPLANSRQTQAQVESEVGRAAENLQRSARHLQRLQSETPHQPISDVAQAVAKVAQEPVAQATQALADTASAAQQQPQQSAPADAAAQKLRDAEAAIAQQAKALADQLAKMGPDPSADNNQQGEESANPANQLARTLDELDRSLTQSRRGQEGQPQPSQQPGQSEQAGQQQQANGDTDPNAQSNQQGNQLASGSQANPSGSANQSGQNQPSSPTLASEARRQMQQMAMNRTLPNQQPANESSPGPQGENASQQGDPAQGQPGAAASSRSGLGSIGSDPDSFRLGEAGARGGGEWGRLRRLEAEDTSVQRRIEVSPEYRRQIEAYFRAIAEQGQER